MYWRERYEADVAALDAHRGEMVAALDALSASTGRDEAGTDWLVQMLLRERLDARTAAGNEEAERLGRLHHSEEEAKRRR